MEKEPPSVPGGPQGLGLAWTLPVLLLVYIGLGYWVGRLAGVPLAGALAGWGVGMWASVREIRKVLRRMEGPPGDPKKGGAA